MKVLAIETSCDETGVSLLEITGPVEKPEVKILGNTLYSQAKLHEEFGGVFPTLAKREHIKNLPPLLAKTLKEAGESEDAPNIDYIAVTTGPGLEPALWAGITFAEELGKRWEKPVIGVNHMAGHVFSILSNLSAGEMLKLPAVALRISGGHTELVMIEEFGRYRLLGQTRDDAAGEAFDKAARMIGLPYPGGPKISALAKAAREKGVVPSFEFPRPMIHSKDLNFSFSGLKTAVLYKVRSLGELTDTIKEEVSLAFEDAVMEVLTKKTRQALIGEDAESLIVAGGVAASERVRECFEALAKEFPRLTLHFPTKTLATDNAVMIGLASYIDVTQNPDILKHPRELKANGNLSLT